MLNEKHGIHSHEAALQADLIHPTSHQQRTQTDSGQPAGTVLHEKTALLIVCLVVAVAFS